MCSSTAYDLGFYGSRGYEGLALAHQQKITGSCICAWRASQWLIQEPKRSFNQVLVVDSTRNPQPEKVTFQPNLSY